MVWMGEKARSIASHAPSMTLLKRDNGPERYPSTFVTLAVIVIAIMVFIVFLALSRFYFLRHRRALGGNGSIPMQGLDGIYLPAHDISPPPVYIRKIERWVYEKPHSTPTRWADTQPLAVALDQDTSMRLRTDQDESQENSPRTTKTRSTGFSPTIQASFLVSLPTPKSTFPTQLRRRTAHLGTSETLNLRNIRNPLLRKTDTDHALNEPAKSHTNDSTSATLGEQRREAILGRMEKDSLAEISAADITRNASMRSNVSDANQAILDRHAKKMGHGDNTEKDLGSFGLGTVTFPLSLSDASESEKQESIKLADLTRILEHSKRVNDLQEQKT